MKFRVAAVCGLTVMAIASPAYAQTKSHSTPHHQPPKSSPYGVHLQQAFDPIGPEVHSLTMASGRQVYYIDEGKPGWKPFVYLSGQGTSLQSFQLTEFARSTRETLHLRAISIERNGFGESPYDPTLGYEDYVDEVLAVLDHLHVKTFAIQAVSGGGAYAAHLAARVPNRVSSLHLASTVTSTLIGKPRPASCSLTMEQRNAANIAYTNFPKVWWAEPADAPVKLVPGWQDEAYLDASRAFFVNGQLGAPDALSHEGMLPCLPGAAVDLSTVKAPAYLYGGDADTSVPIANMALWAAALPNVAAERVYPGEGHTVQYRHWDQILVDMAGLGRSIVVCSHGRSTLVRERDVARKQRRGATLGICAWKTAAAR